MKKEINQTQKEKFIQAAKEHGCDENEKEFEKKLKKIAKEGKNKKEDDTCRSTN